MGGAKQVPSHWESRSRYPAMGRTGTVALLPVGRQKHEAAVPWMVQIQRLACNADSSRMAGANAELPACPRTEHRGDSLAAALAGDGEQVEGDAGHEVTRWVHGGSGAASQCQHRAGVEQACT